MLRPALLLAVAAIVSNSASAKAADCGRACLHQKLDQYFAALFAHDVAGAPFAAGVRATENGVRSALGQGIWRTADAYGTTQRRFFDPKTGQAAYFGEIDEAGQASIVSLRIRVVGQKITESEWTVARKSDGNLFSVEELRENPPPPEAAIGKPLRAPRETMLSAANAYFDAIQSHDGAKIPHIDGCQRLENGFKVTNRAPGAPGLGAGGAGAPGASAAGELKFGDCASGFGAFASMIASASHRRFPLVDEEAGVVMGATIFERPPGSTRKRNLLTEYFYQQSGKISGIYAAMHYMSPDAADTSGWD